MEIYLIKEVQAKVSPSDPTDALVSTSGVLDSSNDTLLLLRDDESLAEIQAHHLTRGHLVSTFIFTLGGLDFRFS